MEKLNWSVCESCLGKGKKNRKVSRKAKLHYQIAYDNYLKNPLETEQPAIPKASSYPCESCEGTGIISSLDYPITDEHQFPHIAIIGLGIGGTALAVACLHRGIPFTIFERDSSFNTRSQGYGLTLQQASKALKSLGISNLNEGIISTRHLVHNPKGEVLGEWGLRKWLPQGNQKKVNRSNIHVARQSLRLALLNQLNSEKSIRWNHQLINFEKNNSGKFLLDFLVDGDVKQMEADLIVGADGIRSTIRQQLFVNETKPLRYLGCIVILGICSLDRLKDQNSVLLDNATVFQTADGNERIYVMPYSKDKIMWQYSFPISEEDAINLSNKGPKSLKKEAIQRITWHSPLPQIINETDESLITGYPVYDREVLTDELKKCNQAITLIGDAAHPMSPFKGQGANQALLDALALARNIFSKYHFTPWKEGNLRIDVLNDFEEEMMERSAVKVKDSAAAAQFLHSEDVLKISNQPRRNFSS